MVAAQGAAGVLNGNAQNSAGQALANHNVQARDLQTGQIVGTSTTDSTGAFSFTQLTPAQYVVEIVDNNKVVGVTAPVAVGAGASAARNVAATATHGASGAAAGNTGNGLGTAIVVVTAAGAAGVKGLEVAAANHASPSR